MSTKFFTKLFVILFLVSLSFVENIQANTSPRIINERLALNSLRNISGAQVTFYATTGNGNFGTLQQLRNEYLIDGALATGEKYFYRFTITVIPSSQNQPARYQVSAVPQIYKKTGIRSFYLDETGVIRGADRNGEPANADDPPVPQLCEANTTVSNMRTFVGAEATYFSTAGNNNYGTLAQLIEQNLIHSSFANGEGCGYSYRVEVFPQTADAPASFNVRSTPRQYGVTGFISYYIDQVGIIRGADKGGAEANEDDPPID